MKRLLLFLLSSMLVFLCAGCGSGQKNNTSEVNSEDKETISVIATIFPLYDFAGHYFGRGDSKTEGEVSMLLAPGMESHSYEPTPQDIIRIQNCDLFLYIGGESDEWVEEMLSSMDQPVNSLKLIDFVEPLEEEGEEGEYDEHIWTSPENAAVMTEAIEKELSRILKEKSLDPSSFEKNAEEYIGQIRKLDREFSDFFEKTGDPVMIFGDRFPLAYFAQRYGITCYAAFPGCYEGAEPSVAEMAQLIDKAEENQVRTIYYIEFSNHAIADAIAETAGCNTAMIHSCHNVSKEEMDQGISYLELMKENYKTITNTLP
ncbi:MAG: zinc ABC transporter substrate-binding protein [Parasporobacterium sp.]|nr:zinc ABC transporter substrate-binding protein [Parasporobacterium sp.]